MKPRLLAPLAACAVVTALAAPSPAAAAAPAPRPEAPAQGAAVQTVPTMTWGKVKGARTYQFQLAADKGFGSIVTGKAIVTENTAATVQKTLADGTYYWRVRGVSAAGKAGRWSSPQAWTKSWSTAPELVSPVDELSVVWPSLPLVLKWKPVPHATSYVVSIATDPSFAQPVLGADRRPLETEGTVWAMPGALAPGRYFWAVTPVDESGFKGRRSRVGSFTWSWPSGTGVRWHDMNPHADLVDPVLEWDAVAGAASYEVEINPTEEFTPGSKVAGVHVTNTSYAPTRQLPNNTYFWRVRAVDPEGNAGAWNAGSFEKRFTPPVANVRLFDAAETGMPQRAFGDTVSQPVVRWDATAGASGYRLRFAPYVGAPGSQYCDLASGEDYTTANPVWTPGTRPASSFLSAHPRPEKLTAPWEGRPQKSWCLWIAAISGDDVISVYTKIEPLVVKGTDDSGSCDAPGAPSYREPILGTASASTPFFRWEHVPGTRAYWVVVARDRQLTNVIDVARTTVAAYSPRTTYRDETTAYYWAVAPSPNGTCVNTSTLNVPDPPSFHKRSTPPALLGPADGSDVSSQPVFRWSHADGAANYKLQVDTNPSFSSPLESVVTASTAYSATTTYPVDAALYWRVRAIDLNDVELNWSRTGTFRRRLAVPSLSAANPPGGDTIPALHWDPVPGAVSYDMDVEQADGTQKSFNVATSAFTPVKWYGTGVWRWKVRARFPAGRSTVAGAFSGSQDYVRRINAPARPQMVFRGGRLHFAWEPDAAATEYRLEVAGDDSFSKIVERVTTPNTSYAPTLTQRGYLSGGRIFWRLANVDSGGNVGAFAHGYFQLPRALKVHVKGAPRRGRPAQLTVTVKGPDGKAVRKASVRAAGAGAKAARARTGKRGVAVVRVRARRAGTVTITVSARGHRTATLPVRVR